MSEEKTILIVDDEPTFKEIIGTQLKALGLKVVTAATGAEAIAKAEKVQPDLILMDIHLGEKETGTDVALSMKQNEKTRNLRVAFLTSLKEPWPGVAGDNQKVAKEIGMEDYLLKTDDPQITGERVRRILEGQSVETPLQSTVPVPPQSTPVPVPPPTVSAEPVPAPSITPIAPPISSELNASAVSPVAVVSEIPPAPSALPDSLVPPVILKID